MTNNQTVVRPKAALKASGLDPTQAAAKAGVGIATVYRCLKNNRWPANRNTAKALQSALGLVETVTP